MGRINQSRLDKRGLSMRGFVRSSTVLAAAGLLAACSHAGSVSRVATDYNRAFADARNEQLLINILRAGAREPLMFSAPAEINASVNRTAGLDTVASNLITGGRDAISPTLRLGGSVIPTVKIAPLSNKEFTEGLLQPITPERLHLFINQGWDAEFLLPLVVDSYRCPGEERIRDNSGETANERSSLLATSGTRFNLSRVVTKGNAITMVVSNERALEMLGSGMAGGYSVRAITPAPAPGMVEVRLSASDKSSWTADMGSLCPDTGRGSVRFTADEGEGEGEAGYLRLRSVEGIIHFLGEAMRPCLREAAPQECAIRYVKGDEKALQAMTLEARRKNTHELFRIVTSRTPALGAAMATSFHDRPFSIPRLDPEDRDRTLKTLSFLTQLIALQTSAVALTPTIIGLPQ
jgi:hypothetical protein